MAKAPTTSEDVEAIETNADPFANMTTITPDKLTGSSRGRIPDERIVNLRRKIDEAGAAGLVATVPCTPDDVKEYGDLVRRASKVNGFPPVALFTAYDRTNGVLQFGLKSLKPVKAGK